MTFSMYTPFQSAADRDLTMKPNFRTTLFCTVDSRNIKRPRTVLQCATNTFNANSAKQNITQMPGYEAKILPEKSSDHHDTNI